MSEIRVIVRDTYLDAYANNVVSGAVGTVPCIFDFDESWDGYAKTVVFYKGSENQIKLSKTVSLLSDETSCDTPFEVLLSAEPLYIGLYGTKDNKVKPTNWSIVNLPEGTYSANTLPPPASPDVYIQLLNKIEQYKQDNSESAAAAAASAAEANSYAQDAQASAESAATYAQDAQASAERAAISEQNIQNAEADVLALKNSIETAEPARVAAESARVAAEQDRVNAETARKNAENARKNAETVRVNAESERQSAEFARASAETARASAESARVTAEQGRVAAEAARQAYHESLQPYLNTFIETIGIGVEYGLEVTPTSPPSNFVNVSAGAARLSNGQRFVITSTSINPIAGSDGINNRKAIIYLDSSGNVATLLGDVDGSVPATPAGGLLLYEVDVRDGTYPINASMLTDKRKFTIGLYSPVKNKSFESVGARINEIEEDAETLEARVTQAETGIDSLQTSIAEHDAEIDALQVRAAQTDAEIDALRVAQAQMSGDTRINLNGTGKITAVPKNAAVLGVGGTIKGMTLTPLVAQSNVPIGSSVTFNSVSGNKYYDGLHKTILTGTGSEMAVTNDTSAAANIYVIDLNAHGLQTKTAGEMAQICPNYISGTQSVMPMRIRTTDESNNTKSVCYIDPKPLRRVPNGVCDTIDLATGKRTINIKEYTIKSSDITNIDTTYTNIDVLSLSKPADFIYYNVAGWDKSRMQALYIEGFAAGVGVSDDISLVYTMFNRNITNIGLIVPKGAYSDIAAARAAFAGKKIWYQLATPVIEHNVVTGSLLSYPKGLILCEPVLADAGVYNDGITILRTDYPIQSLETLCKINPDGTQTPLDVSAATITDAGTKITHPALFNGDIVAFTYFTASSGIIGENVFNYVNANGLTLGADGKYYRVGFAIDINGNISLTKTEVV